MKFNFEHELLTAQTDSVFVAKQLILIIEELDRREEEKYAHDENGNRIPYKGAIIMPDPLDEPKKYIEPLKNRVKEDTPAMNITSRLHEEPADIEDEEIEIDSVPTDEEPQPEIPHGQKIKSEDIEPQEGTVEEAYLGEHFEIQPKDPDEKPLTPAEQELWDYIQANPNYTMQGACRALKITTANYYWRKRQLFLKGKPVGGSLPFAAKPKD